MHDLHVPHDLMGCVIICSNVKSASVFLINTLERITHEEKPWLIARKGYDDGIPSHEIIPKESIKRYFMAVNQKYSIATEEGLREYIATMIQ